jgi:hypothetical protein
MNEKLEIFLESSTAIWDNYKRPEKPVQITIFIDPQGGVWNIGDGMAPCGGPAECRANAYRQYWFCEKHTDEGVLICQHRDSGWYWFSGKLEVKKL